MKVWGIWKDRSVFVPRRYRPEFATDRRRGGGPDRTLNGALTTIRGGALSHTFQHLGHASIEQANSPVDQRLFGDLRHLPKM